MNISYFKKWSKRFLLTISIITILSGSLCICVCELNKTKLAHGAVLRVFHTPFNLGKNATILIVPGGGYATLSRWNEGYLWIPFLYNLGYSVAVLEYNMPHQKHYIPIRDATEAMIALRKRARDSGKDEKIGIMGFSAGGHLASTVMLSKDDNIRPDFAILFYPVVSMKKELTHIQSHDNFLGKNAPEELEIQFSNECHITDNTPPVYIAVSQDDLMVNPYNSYILYKEMRKKGRKVTIHTYPTGDHGWGFRRSFSHRNQMLSDLKLWLNDLDSLL